MASTQQASVVPQHTVDETTELSKKYDTPMGLAHDTMQALKDRIKTHYDLASEYYLSLWYVPKSVRLRAVASPSPSQ